MPRRWLYPLIGLILALGAPWGYFLLQSWVMGVLPLEPVWESELSRDTLTYTYLFLATSIVFALTGYIVGRRHDVAIGILRRRLGDVTDA